MDIKPSIPIDLSEYPRFPEHIPPASPKQGEYQVDYARTPEELDEIFHLRYRVFNLEMEEGLEAAHRYQRDFDEYDPNCHHIFVRHHPTQRIIGTYRFQTQAMAGSLGFYGQTEFTLNSLPADVLAQGVEVGRACIDQGHRNGRILIMLWRGMIRYLQFNGCRYLFGCCSINSQVPIEGEALYQWLLNHNYVDTSFDLQPQPGFECQPDADAVVPPQTSIPTLMRLYLQNDVKVIGRPAIDRAFKTIDYFVLFDMEQVSDKTKKVILPPSV